MRYCHTALQDFVQSHSPFSPVQSELEGFGQRLEAYLASIADSKSESEEHQKNLLRDFLYKSFGYDCNTRDKIDLAIYDDSIPRVLFEVKSSGNSHEFVKPSVQNPSLESKAFYESILYYLRETLTNRNNNLTHIILTNTEDFYIIDAKDYAAFAKDKAILKAFKNCEDKEGNDASTRRFYDELSNLLPSLDMELKYTHFKIEDSILANYHESLCHSEAVLAGEESQHTKNKESYNNILPLLYQVLSPHVLLKRKTYLDANTLNQDFYDELLYILGLRESTQNAKVLILSSQTQNTLLDSICLTFGLDRDKDFEILFSLLTTWNNRLLFLRLLESMLLNFEHIKKPFLDLDYLKDFQALNMLFFDILAKIEESRDANIPKALSSIPYLNSSLFEKTALEIEGKEIKLLESKPLMLYHDSILYKDKNFCKTLNLNAQAKDSSLPLLEYLFAFLHAYNFTTTPQDIQNHTKMNYDKLINSAVLGLVFEKLNGYKEGSFYTPSFITHYMCKQSLERVVLQKFNESLDWDCKDLESLKTKLDKLTDSKEGYKRANAIFDSIHICDPAVGSGHFLVSALNELILLKFKLGILCDENHNRIKDITLEILRDEIVIRDSNNTLFAYTLPKHENIETHKIQKALFSAKRKLIESCLFGVDINPNSCEITKLRLWIELLKYSYYKDIPNKRLETLPNIDINIKCGNSLISRFNLSDSLRTIPNINFQIEQYKKLVFEYKNADQNLMKISKQDIEKQIETIQTTFTITLKDPKTKKELEKAIESHIKQFNNYLLDDASLLDGLGSLQFNLFGTPNLSEEEQEKALESYGKIQALRKKLDLALSGAEYKNAFEWRFAFPEVLDSNGDFLGFDLVIGNPPYGVKLTTQERERYKKTYLTSQTNTAALFIYLSDRILTNQGVNSLIVPKSLNYIANWKEIRHFLEPTLFLLVDCGKAWSYVLLEMVIFAKQKNNITQTYKTHFLEDSSQHDKRDISLVAQAQYDKMACHSEALAEESQAMTQNQMMIDKKLIDLFDVFLSNLNKEELEIGLKLKKHKINLLDLAECFRGGSFQNKVQKTKFKDSYEVLGGKEVQKYVIVGIKGYVHKDFINDESNIKENSILLQRIIAHIQNPTPHIKFTATIVANGDERKIVNTIFQIICKENISNKYILGLFHSKLINWYCYRFCFSKAIRSMDFSNEIARKIPIPKITKQNQKIVDRIIALVDEILAIKAACHSKPALAGEESQSKELRGSKRDVSGIRPQHGKLRDTNKLESEIDYLVYKLYNLTDNEIRVIENKG